MSGFFPINAVLWSVFGRDLVPGGSFAQTGAAQHTRDTTAPHTSQQPATHLMNNSSVIAISTLADTITAMT